MLVLSPLHAQEGGKVISLEEQMKRLKEEAAKRGESISFSSDLESEVVPAAMGSAGYSFYTSHYHLSAIDLEIRLAAERVENPSLKRLLLKLADSKDVGKKFEFLQSKDAFDLTFLDDVQVQGDNCYDECSDICTIVCGCITRGGKSEQACHRECHRICHRVCKP